LINSWTNALNTGYSNSLEAQKLEQTESSGIGGILGAVGGIARSFFAEKGGEVPWELSPSGGAIPDDVSLRATPGERVVDARTAQYFGSRYFDNLKKRAHDAMGIQEEVV